MAGIRPGAYKNSPMIWLSLPIALVLFALIVLSLRYGWHVGRRRLATLGENANEGVGAVEGAIFAMMGLLLAFSFTGAAGRFEQRRDLIVQETNAIGTAWLRLDLLREGGPREQAQDLLRRYLDQRIDVYGDVTDWPRTLASLEKVAALQTRIGNLVLAQSREDKSQPIPQVLVPALNDMFDIATTRVLATRQHPHYAIFVMLGVLVLVSAFLAGFGQSKVPRQSRLHVLGFATTTALALYLIIDLEYPRFGLIRVDSFDQALVELRKSMN
jgi:hypothetical protein